MSCAHTALRSLGGGTCPVCVSSASEVPFATPRTVQAVFDQFRSDAWQNLQTGLGTAADKRTGGGLVLSVVTSAEARDLWRGNDLAATIIESSPKDELRRGFTLKISSGDGSNDKELAEKIMTALEAIPGPSFVGKGLSANLVKARCFERAYGGGAIFPWINDAEGSLAEPLNENNIGKIERLVVYEPRELRPTRFYPNTHPKAGDTSHYQIVPISGMVEGSPFLEIHETRLVLFPGIRVSREQLVGVEYGWGDNVLTRVRDVLNDFELTFGSAANILQDFSQAVLKLDNLAELLGADGSTLAQTRLSEMNRWRSVLRAIVIDGKDSFTRETTSLAGVPDMMDRFMFRLAATARMPVSKLMGMAPAGLNATGEADGDNWDDEVGSGQEHLKPRAERIIQLFMLSKDSPTRGKEPAVWSIEFCPLSEPTEKENAETRKLNAETDAIYIDRMVYSADECGLARFGGDTYSNEILINYKRHEQAVANGNANAAADPTAGPTVGAGAPAANVASTAFNGAQISSMIEVIKAGIAKEIPIEAARLILVTAFASVTPEMAIKLVPDGYVPPPVVAATPFGGAPFGGKPAAPPAPDAPADPTPPPPADPTADPPADPPADAPADPAAKKPKTRKAA